MSVTIETHQKFHGLDVIRAAAACLVVLAHASFMQTEARFGGVAAFGGKAANLSAGVDFFFVLSGFLIPWVHWNDFGKPARIWRYAKRRFTRIYPIYWVVLTFSILVHLYRPSTNHDVALTVPSAASSYLLIANGGPPHLQVAWTMYIEVWGYVLFAVALLLGRRSLWVLFAYAVVIIAWSVFAGGGTFPTSFFLNPYQLEFLMGIGVSMVLRYSRVPSPRLVAFAGIGLFLAAIYVGPKYLTNDTPLGIRLMMGGFAALAIAGMVEWERGRSFRVPAWLRNFAGASYSIYLTHTLVEGPAMSAGWAVFRHWSPEARVMFVGAIAIAIGYAFHLIVETPLTEIVKNAILPDAEPASSPPGRAGDMIRTRRADEAMRSAQAEQAGLLPAAGQ